MRYLTIAGLCIGLVVTATAGATASYVASKKSNVYHLPTCRYVSKITKEHLISFDTKTEAEAKGYRPWKVCKP